MNMTVRERDQVHACKRALTRLRVRACVLLGIK